MKKAIELLEKIKEVAGKSQKDVFYYLTADQTITELRKRPGPTELTSDLELLLRKYTLDRTSEELIQNTCTELGCQAAEIKRLKKRIKQIQQGNVTMPKFEPNEENRQIVAMFPGLDLSKPENAYLWGWETCLLEIGEILSKP